MRNTRQDGPVDNATWNESSDFRFFIETHTRTSRLHMHPTCFQVWYLPTAYSLSVHSGWRSCVSVCDAAQRGIAWKFLRSWLARPADLLAFNNAYRAVPGKKEAWRAFVTAGSLFSEHTWVVLATSARRYEVEGGVSWPRFCDRRKSTRNDNLWKRLLLFALSSLALYTTNDLCLTAKSNVSTACSTLQRRTPRVEVDTLSL